jgi:CotS family spore coat protein
MVDERRLQIILEEYPISAQSIVQIREHVYKIYSPRHVYCLKYLPSLDSLKRSHHILQHLLDSGFSKCCKIIRTYTDLPYVQPTNESGGWLLTNWIEGSAPRFSSRTQLSQAVQLLAEFHTHAVGVPFLDSFPEKGRYNSLIGQWEERYQNMQTWLQEEYTPALEKAVELAALSLEKLRAGTAESLVETESKNRGVVHGDYNYPNLVRTQAGMLYMIDFDNSSHDVRILDLAHIMQRNVFKQIAKAQWMLQEYEKIRPLSGEERGVLASLLAFPYQFWRKAHIRKYYQKEVTPKHWNDWGKLYLSRRYTRHWIHL